MIERVRPYIPGHYDYRRRCWVIVMGTVILLFGTFAFGPIVDTCA